MLEHHIDRAPIGRNAGDVLAANKDFAFAWLLKSRHHAQAGGLAAARGAKDREKFAGLDSKVVLDNCGHFTKPLGNIPEFDNRLFQDDFPTAAQADINVVNFLFL